MDKSKLFQPRIDEESYEIPKVGMVKFRALSRKEAMTVQGKEMPVEVMERKLLSMAMLDPVVSEDDVAKWQEASPAGELEIITRKISEMSGMTAEFAKEAYKSIRGKSRS